MVYWLRTSRPDYYENSMINFDQIANDSLQHILGVPMTEQNRNIVHLPLSLGEIGIPKASASKEAAFIASVGSSWYLQQI